MEDAAPDDLAWLTRWYAARCDGEWEHRYGVTIESLDNPGWRVRIDLRGTPLEAVAFSPVIVNADPPDGDPDARWRHCIVSGGRFEGAGGAHDLGEILAVFRAWAQANDRR
jgi:hypothetical protein